MTMNKKEVEELLEHVWSLYENQDDTSHPGLVQSVMYFSSQFDFDIEVLPPKLYADVVEEIRKQREESYWDDQAASAMDEELPY